MPRTTANAVAAIIETDPTILNLDPFIEAASNLVDHACATVLDSSGSAYYTTAQLTQIETWLAAHCYEVRDKRPGSEAAGSVSASYPRSLDVLLYTSEYGQMAMMLDTAGGLSRLCQQIKSGKKGMKPRIVWLGKATT